jgi:cell division protein FtsB
MPTDRPHDRSRRPRGRTGPTRRPGAARPSRPHRAAARQQAAATVAAAQAQKQRSRLTGRAAVLVLVLAVLVVSYASSMRAYLQQRSHINDLKSSIAEHQSNIDALETEKERWEDPAYVEQQARERLGYVRPGEKTYLVLGEDGQPLEPAAELGDPSQVISTQPTAWWGTGWDSVQLAGNPPRIGKPPASEIDGTGKGTGGEDSRGETPEAP